MGRHVGPALLFSLAVYLFLNLPASSLSQGVSSQNGHPVRPSSLHLRPRAAIPVFVNPAYFRSQLQAPPSGLDEFSELSNLNVEKRQFDDYGHMRFGKRGEAEDKFDDYGHMRFGRST